MLSCDIKVKLAIRSVLTLYFTFMDVQDVLVSDISDPVILETDFMCHFSAYLNFRDYTISLGNEIIPDSNVALVQRCPWLAWLVASMRCWANVGSLLVKYR